MADRTFCIGLSPPTESYLRVGMIITAALGTGAGAILPGYDILTEQPEFPVGCGEYGLTFIRPTAETIRRRGDKLEARDMVK
jgi:acetyl-CoA carboxylase biotin carboxylase subunit